MTEVGFYHLTRSTLDEALPRLLEKAYAAGNRVLVRVGDPERLELLNRALWTYGKESFLPHGTRSDGFAEEQPIYLTTQVENPNGATILVLVDGRRSAGPRRVRPLSRPVRRRRHRSRRPRPRALARGTRGGPRLHLLAAGRARRLGQGRLLKG